jgi:LysM repeat protein
MKRLIKHSVVILLLLLLATGRTFAQGQNLLTNPGFEPPYSTLTGNPPPQVAQGWQPWWVSGGPSESENVQPEYYRASDVSSAVGGVPRIRSGQDAQLYYSFFATHDGGLYQQVSGVTAGTPLRFSAYVYVWSSSFDDPNRSENDGGVVVQVGIDPNGGTDGTSANIVWSQAIANQYDAYNLYSVDATPTGNRVTVFIRSTVSTPVKNNNIYVDDASLTATGAGQATQSAPPTATQTPKPAATNTPVPPPTATNTVAPPTSVPPTNTPVPLPATSTVSSQPGATATSGDLGIVTATLPPSATVPPPTSTPPPTETPVVPTATPIVIVVTATQEPATATVPPTAESATATPTQEQAATETPTSTPPFDSSVFPSKIVHTVRPGDNVATLAILYDSTIEAIIAANGLNQSALIRVGQGLVIPVRLPAPATVTPTAAPPGSGGDGSVPPSGGSVYIVRPGDTLSRIAARFNTTTATLAQLNGIANPNVIRYGQRLIIPSGAPVVQPTAPAPTQAPNGQPRTYTVRFGDTLFRIALRFGVPVKSIIQANNIANINRIYVGQVLVIP